MKVVLYGCTGQVGEALLNAFADEFQWVLPRRDSSDGDLLNPEGIYTYLLEESPQAIVNAAAYTDVDGAEARTYEATVVNAFSPRAMALAAKKTGAYFVHLSTDYVFNGQGNRPWQENDPVSPINAYGRTKAEGEAAVFKSNPNCAVLRLSWLHAARHKNFVTALLNRLTDQRNISVVDDQWGAPTAAADVANVVAQMLVSHRQGVSLNGIYHFSNSGFCSRYDCAQAVLQWLRENRVQWADKCSLKRIKTADLQSLASRPLNCRLDSNKLQRALKIAPRSWQAALGATLEQCKRNGLV